ncbi:HAMP domain-containing protein [Nakamurella sp. YIM 132087]|uniref:Signal transduction histidine-protein kinase/phosphatase MprB n=1 Tax=Nakamurella alba TaxID=2665158 RepID=A0A7K1FJ41_9ACTN|nr:HAMP domain-containing sensor histidine kinase [Nakamurella alba]MTD14142.1 HAMP domain-containing protein [Nakamurella alba]
MRRRVLASILMVMLASVLALGVPLAIVSYRLVTDGVRTDLLGRLESVAGSLGEQAALPELDLAPYALLVPDGGLLQVRMSGGRAGEVPGPGFDPAVQERFAEEVSLSGGGSVRLSVPADRIESEQRTALLLVSAAVLLSLAVGAGIALVLARRLSRPLVQVADRAARLGAGDFRPVPERYGIAELDRVAEVLDTSAGDIAALIGRERDLVGDVTHQLRTRLTGLRLQVEELATQPDPDLAAAARAALQQTDQLVAVVDDLLATARERRAAGAEPLPLVPLLVDLVDRWQPTFGAAGRRLDLVTGAADTVVRATPVRLREAVEVLLDNALRHGAGTVTVTVRDGAGTVVTEVEDQGGPITPGLAAHIFDRGMSTASSTGIGLDLARAFVESDGGRLELRRPAPPTFAIYLLAHRP